MITDGVTTSTLLLTIDWSVALCRLSQYKLTDASPIIHILLSTAVALVRLICRYWHIYDMPSTQLLPPSVCMTSEIHSIYLVSTTCSWYALRCLLLLITCLHVTDIVNILFYIVRMLLLSSSFQSHRQQQHCFCITTVPNSVALQCICKYMQVFAHLSRLTLKHKILCF